MRWSIPVLALAIGCGAPPLEDVEGDSAGECSDGVDNDQDGMADCDDSGCAVAADCDGSMETPTPTAPGGGGNGSGSGDTDTGSTLDTGTPPSGTTEFTGPTLMTYLEYGCVDLDTWKFSVETQGWTNGGLVNMWETGAPSGWNEEHTLESFEQGADNTWDHLERTLQDEATPSGLQQDVNSVFTCGEHDADPVMTYMIRIYDTSDALADCWILATDPTGVATVMSGGAPNMVPITDPSDIMGCTPM